ncbi:hypothetical protein GPALN_006680 [Globodera pallida]|nr:hypothetical protein GPALN_006680 [Globodera pallida]
MTTAMDNKRGLDESILDDFSDEETPPKRAKVTEGIMATIDCQPSTSREGNQTGTGKMENEIGALVQANPMFVSQLATVAGQLLGTVLREERTGTTKVWRGRGSTGRGGCTRRGGGTWGSPNFPQAKRDSNESRQPHQLAATASETIHELAEHSRTSNPELAILLVSLETGMAELSYHAKTGHWCSR